MFIMFKKEKTKETKTTYTKSYLTKIINVALIDMQLPFLLALLGREQIAETLGGIIVTEIVGVSLGYFAKSFFETKEQEKTKLLEKQLNHKLSLDTEEYKDV